MRFLAFAKEVLRVPLTRAQRVLAAVAFDGVEPEQLDAEDRETARQLFGEVSTIPPSARAVLVAVLGARAGKSYIFVAIYSLWRALFADLSTLAPGERATALIVAPDIRLGKQALRYAAGAIRADHHLRRLLVSEAADSLVLVRPDGREVAIEVLPASRGGSAVRGRSLVSACLDESAFFRDADAVVNDEEIFKAVAPRVLPGGLVVVASTPYAEKGLMYELFSRNHERPRDALAARGPTLLMLPSDRNRETVAREQERDPENAAREYGAEFITGGSTLLFSPELLRDCFVGEQLPESQLASCTLGGDIGLVADSSAFVPVFRYPADPVLRAGQFVEMRPRPGAPLKLSAVVERAAALASEYRTRRCWVDHHVLQPAREHCPLGFQLQPVPGGQAAKADRFLAVRALMREERLIAPKTSIRLRAQLGEIYTRPTPGGGLQVIQRRTGGAHGDIASAFVVAGWASARGAGLTRALPTRERGPRAYEEQTESAREMVF